MTTYKSLYYTSEPHLVYLALYIRKVGSSTSDPCIFLSGLKGGVGGATQLGYRFWVGVGEACGPFPTRCNI